MSISDRIIFRVQSTLTESLLMHIVDDRVEECGEESFDPAVERKKVMKMSFFFSTIPFPKQNI